MLSYLIQGLGMGIYAGVLPGPTQAFILSKTIKNGWKNALPLAFVPLVSDLPIALLFCLLVSALPANLLLIIQLFGGGYLVFLGHQTWKAAKVDGTESTQSEQARGFWQTVGINFTNPNVYVFWGTIGAPIVVSGWNQNPATGLAFILGMYTMLVLVVASTILLFGLTGNLPEKAKFWVLGILALIVAVFGLYQFVTGAIKLLTAH
jgi:threonine/homoserine/homoserine lactone efflux protein